MKLSLFDDSIVKIEHSSTEQTPELTDYRYIGSSPNNYVCLEEEKECTDANLYRIIGVIPTQSSLPSADNPNENILYEKRVKLIKNTPYEENESGLLQKSSYTGSKYGYLWSKNSTSWETSTLNTSVLNQIYWNDIEAYQKYIAIAKWYLNGPANGNNPSHSTENYYTAERNSASTIITYIGLMYPSDVGYSIGPSYRNESIYEKRTDYQKVWMHTSYYEWTISKTTTYNCAFALHVTGHVDGDKMTDSNYYEIRPTFYLNKDVEYKSGDGSYNNPYKIKLNQIND